MKRNHCLLALVLFSILFSSDVLGQAVTLSGNIKNNATGESVPAVTVKVKGSASGTFSDDKGNFRLTTNQKPPFTLEISAVNFQKEVIVNSASEFLQIDFVPVSTLGVEVVVSASRVAERMLESPVSIERLSVANIRDAASPNAYDMLANLKGVDIVTSSLTFKTPTTRGFGGSGNFRVNQFMDGMDNQAPGLNFSVGSIIGITDLDLESVELLPGASSALYGAGGTNGTILMNSKNPFKYTGLSVQVKQGIMHTDSKQRSASPYYDWSFRYAKAFNDKFAFKVNMTLIKASDWENENYSNYDRINFRTKGGDRNSDPAYDGVNVYGDENAQNMVIVGTSVLNALAPAINQYRAVNPNATPQQIAGFLATIPTAAPLVPVYTAFTGGKIPNENVTRTGYQEQDVVDYNTLNYKFNGALHYKISSNAEAILSGNWGTGTTVYTGADRYSLRNLKMGQYKLEVRGSDYYVRAYTTQENAGESYNSSALAALVNEAWKPSTTWYPQYLVAYSTAVNAGAPSAVAHAGARNFADQGRYLPGSQQFNTTKESIRKNPIPAGALFTDKTDMYHVEGFYDASKVVNKVVDIQLGANYRLYDLNSNGSIFADKNGRDIKINEYGFFLQVAKRMFDEKLKLTASGRFDKSKNFKGRFTPRVSAVYTVAPDQNIRVSYQNAFRIPHNQNQYIDLDVVTSRLIGGLDEFKETYNLITNQTYTVSSVAAARNAFFIAGQSNPASVPGALALLKPYDFTPDLVPESMKAFEVGYKGLFGKRVLLDAFFYYSKYRNFIGQAFVAQSKPVEGASDRTKLLNPGTTQVYSVSVNNPGDVNALGGGLSVDVLLTKAFSLNTNVSYNELSDAPADFFTQFNTPKYRFNLGLSNSEVFRNVGFNVVYRYQSSFLYEGTFAVGDVPAFGTLDAQISHKWPKQKIMAKLGATNLLNKYYNNAFGNPAIGGLYYISVGYNVF